MSTPRVYGDPTHHAPTLAAHHRDETADHHTTPLDQQRAAPSSGGGNLPDDVASATSPTANQPPLSSNIGRDATSAAEAAVISQSGFHPHQHEGQRDLYVICCFPPHSLAMHLLRPSFDSIASATALVKPSLAVSSLAIPLPHLETLALRD